jgi:redox-sensitive bicupin YhaK (pirin superfamily)
VQQPAKTKGKSPGASDGIRFLLVSGKPLQEPVAWYGPIVMNAQEQLRQAFEELREGTFLKPGE